MSSPVNLVEIGFPFHCTSNPDINRASWHTRNFAAAYLRIKLVVTDLASPSARLRIRRRRGQQRHP
jgi:hypothetical protein